MIVGSSRTEDAVYEFVGYLKTVPQLTDLALEGTQPIQLEEEEATRFDVKCRFVDSSANVEGASDNG